MKGGVSNFAITKIQTVTLVIVIFVAAIVGLFAYSSRQPASRPSSSPTAMPTLTVAPTATLSPIPTALPNGEGGIIIGVEYVISGIGEDFGGLRIPAVKPLPGSFSWDKMQTGPNETIDFSFTDKYVKEFQDSGFTVIVFGLRTSKQPSCGPVDDRPGIP